MSKQYEIEEEAICDAYAAGLITNAEMWKELNELRRDYQAAAEEAAREVYDRELENW